jgi:hypothetical protein
VKSGVSDIFMISNNSCNCLFREVDKRKRCWMLDKEKIKRRKEMKLEAS